MNRSASEGAATDIFVVTHRASGNSEAINTATWLSPGSTAAPRRTTRVSGVTNVGKLWIVTVGTATVLVVIRTVATAVLLDLVTVSVIT